MGLHRRLPVATLVALQFPASQAGRAFHAVLSSIFAYAIEVELPIEPLYLRVRWNAEIPYSGFCYRIPVLVLLDGQDTISHAMSVVQFGVYLYRPDPCLERLTPHGWVRQN